MSVASDSFAMVSLGVSCQTAMQIRAHIPLISEMIGAELHAGEHLDTSSFPFDWRIMPPKDSAKWPPTMYSSLRRSKR
jgi:hypothetical protein